MLSPVKKKVHLLLSAHIKIHPHICLELFWTGFACKQFLIWAYFSPDSEKMAFSLEKAILRIVDLYFSWKQRFDIKIISFVCFLETNPSFSLDKMLIDGWESCRLLWCFYQLFGISFWRHPFTAEHPLVSKWWKATFLQICSD